MKFFARLLRFAMVAGLLCTLSSMRLDAQCIQGYQYEQPIIVNNTTQTLNNYFVLLNINTANLIRVGKMKADGSDIRFSQTDCCTPLSYWIEDGINTSQTLIWVKVNQLLGGVTKGGTNTTVNMFYGNPAAVAGSSRDALFGAGLAALYTFTEGSGTILHDRSGNGFDMNIFGPTWAPGYRNGVNSLTGFSTTNRVYYNGNGPALGTGSFFAFNFSNLPNVTTGIQSLIGNFPPDNIAPTPNLPGWAIKVQFDGNGQILFLTGDGPTFCQQPGAGTMSINTWNFVGGRRRTGVDKTVYINGANVGTLCAGDAYNLNGPGPFELGNGKDLARPIQGSASITAVYTTAPTDAEITALYNSLYAPVDPTYSFGTEVSPSIAAITSNPSGATVCQNSPYTFTVGATATNGGTATYQWRKGGNPISGAIGSSYTIPSVQTTDAGSYDVIVSTNGACPNSVTSTAAALAVNIPPSVTVQPVGKTLCVGQPVSFTAGGAGSSVTYQWRKNGSNIPGAIGTTYAIPSVALADSGNYDFTVIGICPPTPAISNVAVLKVLMPPTFSQQPTAIGALSASVLPAYSFARSTGIFTSIANGSLTSVFTAAAGGGGVDDQVSAPIAIGFPFIFDGASYTDLTISTNGVIGLGTVPVTTAALNDLRNANVPVIAPFWDDLRIGGGANGCGSPNIGYQLSGATPNRILKIQYRDIELVKNRTAWGTFQVWLYEGTNRIEFRYGRMSNCAVCNSGTQGCDTTSASIGLASGVNNFIDVLFTGGNAGSSTTLVDNNIDLAKTMIGTDLRTPTTGFIYTFTPTVSICRGQSVTLTSSVLGFGNLVYQWRFNGVPIPGANGPTYTRTYEPYNAGVYDLTVTGNCNPGTISNPLRIGIVAEPIIEEQPVDFSALLGETVTFRVRVTGGGALGYQWYKDGVRIPGATLPFLTIPNVTADSRGEYNVVITGTQCNSGSSSPVVSNRAALLIDPPASIAKNPSDITACIGSSASFSVSAVGVGNSYQWKKNGVAIPGAISPTLLIGNVNAADSGSYSVEVHGRNGQVLATTPAKLTVNLPPAIGTQPSNLTVCAGQPANFTVAATGSGLQYQWRKNGVLIATGGNAAGFTIPAAAMTDTGSYDVIVLGACNDTVSSTTALLTVNVAPSITQDATPSTQKVKKGTQVTYTVAGVGTGLTYQWYHNNTVINGQTSATYTIASVTKADEGTYFAVVSGLCPPPDSSAFVTLQVDTSILAVPNGFESVTGTHMTVIPQPARGTTRVTVMLPSDIHLHAGAHLALYDAAGKEILDLSDAFKSSGFISAEFDASRIPSGMYYCQLNSPEWKGSLGAIIVTK